MFRSETKSSVYAKPSYNQQISDLNKLAASFADQPWQPEPNSYSSLAG
jgi:hypothetical protein